MTLTAQDVSEIIRLLQDSDFDELNLEIGDLKLRLRRGENGAFEETGEPTPEIVRPERSRGAKPQDAEPSSRSSPAFAGEGDRAKHGGGDHPNGTVPIPSPMLGIFYRAPKPGADPYVAVGQRVEEDTIIGIVEVMKLMNSIRAGVRGEVVEIVARNAEMVEYGDPLLRVRPAAE